MKLNTIDRQLVEALQGRNLNINTTQLLQELSNDDQGVRGTWISENLGHETLLTKEELSLYNSLQKSGRVDALLELEEESHVRALTDHELQEAIAQLQTSTAAIEKQSEILRVQQDAVASLVALNSRQAQSRAADNGSQHRTWVGENEHVNSAVEELATDLSDYVAEIESQCEAADSSLGQHAAEILHSDDKTLTSLMKMSGALELGSGGADDHSERIKTLCASLIKYTVEGVRVRLDRLYIEGLAGTSGSLEDTGSIQSAEMTALKEELESLYSEILPVAQMSASQRYLSPALLSISAHSGDGASRSLKIAAYISGCLSFLLQRLEAFSLHAADYQEHTATLRTLTQLLRAELTSHLTSPTPPQQPSSPRTTKRRKSRITSLNRPRLPHRRSSSLTLSESTPHEHQLLQILGLPLPDTPSTSSSLTAALQTTLSDRQQKLRAHDASLQGASEAAVGSHVQDAFVTLQLLRDCLLSESKTGRVELVDADVQAAVEGLEGELAEVRSELHSVDLERLRGRDVKREAFVERWAHQ